MAIKFRNDEKFVIDFGVTDIVRDWADDDGIKEPIRIDAVRKFVEDEWRLKWNERDEIIQAFRVAKEKHREAIHTYAGVDARYGVRHFDFGQINPPVVPKS